MRYEPQIGDSGAVSGVYVDLPHLLKLQYRTRGISFLPGQPITSLLSGRHASRLRGRGLNFEELRTYLPGDDIRCMDWKATARTRKAQIRVYTEERDRPCLLVLDQRLSMFFGSVANLKSVTAAEAAALAAWKVQDSGDRVGAVLFNDSEVDVVRPARSRRSVTYLMQRVVDFNNSLHVDNDNRELAHPLNDALLQADRLATHSFLVVVISDFSEADGQTRRLLTRMSRHNDVLAAHVFDPLEVELPPKGQLPISNGREQMVLEASQAKLQADYKRTYTENLANAEKVLSGLKVPRIPLSTARDVVTQVQQHLGYSPRSRRG